MDRQTLNLGMVRRVTHKPHILEQDIEAPHSTYECVICKNKWSGLEPTDIIRLQTLGLGKCPGPTVLPA